MSDRRAGGRWHTVAAAALLSALLTLLAAGTAHAATAKLLQVSTDGTSYGDTPAALFPSGLSLVPGADATADLWVRNAAPDGGTLTVALRGQTTLSDQLTVSVSLDGSTPTSVHPGSSTSAVPVGTRWLTAGQSTRITFTITLSEAADNADQQKDVDLDFEIGLGQSIEVLHASETAPQPGTAPAAPAGTVTATHPAGTTHAAPLATTGFGLERWMTLAAWTFAGGTLLLLAGRRRSHSRRVATPSG